MSDDSVTKWIRGLAQGDRRSEEEIWQRYFQRLVSLARGRLGGLPRGAADEEDVALSALNSFFLGARAGRFPKLDDRNDLWKLLLVISTRKSIAQQRRHYAGVRPDRRMALQDSPSDRQSELEAVLGHEPSPAFAAECAEELRRHLQELPDNVCRQIAIFRLEGYTNREIAQLLGTYEVKVERKLRLIRKCWSTLMEDANEAQ